MSFQERILILEVDSEASSDDVVTASGRAWQAGRSILNSSIDVVELKFRMSVPVPVEGKRDAVGIAACDSGIVEVSIRVSDAHVPCSPTTISAAIASVDEEEVLEWFDPSDSAALATPRDVFARQEV